MSAVYQYKSVYIFCPHTCYQLSVTSKIEILAVSITLYLLSGSELSGHWEIRQDGPDATYRTSCIHSYYSSISVPKDDYFYYDDDDYYYHSDSKLTVTYETK